MGTKEAIEFCEGEIKEYGEVKHLYGIEKFPLNKPVITAYKSIIRLLKRGEAYEKMWGELYTEYGMCPIRKNDEEGYMSNILYKILEELERKYFRRRQKIMIA